MGELVHYIADAGVVAVFTRTDDANPATDRTRWLHRDHLGSVVMVTDEAGLIAEIRSFDAWGKLRNADWTVPGATAMLESARGFTGHEHLDNVGLIHMNGRVYDPALGRMLSADPFVQDPTFTQSFNRYSYVINNPLSFTDPSGFQADPDLENYRDTHGDSRPDPKDPRGDLGDRNYDGRDDSTDTTFSSTFSGDTGALDGKVPGGTNPRAIDITPENGIGPGAIQILVEWLIGEDWGARWRSLSKFLALRADTENEAAKHLAAAFSDGLDGQINDNKYGHAVSASYAQRQLGAIGTPVVTMVGVLYEVYRTFSPGHVPGQETVTPPYSLTDGQHPVNWAWDTPGDILANTFGQLSALLGLDYVEVNKLTFMIPGPNYSLARSMRLGVRQIDLWGRVAPPGAYTY